MGPALRSVSDNGDSFADEWFERRIVVVVHLSGHRDSFLGREMGWKGG
jgi:hypothetical protein